MVGKRHITVTNSSVATKANNNRSLKSMNGKKTNNNKRTERVMDMKNNNTGWKIPKS